jgi:hypothetical protein
MVMNLLEREAIFTKLAKHKRIWSIKCFRILGIRATSHLSPLFIRSFSLLGGNVSQRQLFLEQRNYLLQFLSSRKTEITI